MWLSRQVIYSAQSNEAKETAVVKDTWKVEICLLRQRQARSDKNPSVLEDGLWNSQDKTSNRSRKKEPNKRVCERVDQLDMSGHQPA